MWENEKFNRGRWKIFILEQIIANHLIWLKMKREDEIKWFEREWNEFSKFHFSKSHTFYSVELKGRLMKIFNFLPINLTEYEVWKNEKFSTLSKWSRRYRNKLITLNKVVWERMEWIEIGWNFSKSHTFYSVELKGRLMKIFNFLPINLTE